MNPCELTQRQTAVLNLMCEGLHNKEIARRLDISPRTVEIHRAKAMRIIGARNSVHAVHIWLSRRHAIKVAAAAPITQPRSPTPPADRPVFQVWHDGLIITRNGDYFAQCATPAIASALALALDSAQWLFDPIIPSAIQDDITTILWPDTPAKAPNAPPSVAPDMIRGNAALAAQPLETLLSQPWEA